MRFRRLDLIRFGSFTDRTLELTRSGNDLHLIVGANEAGKSTTRAAIGDLLFGIDGRSPYGFLHDYRDLCVGAVLENGGDSLTVRRRKRLKDALTDAEGIPLPESRLATLLGGSDRISFERMFSLDHQALVSGGQSILSARGEVGRMLFESASGIGGLATFRTELEQEASTLWTPRKNQSAAFHRAAGALKAAQDRLREAAVRVPEWNQLRKAADAASASLEEITRACEGLELERVRLERLRRAAPLLAYRAQKLAERAELGDTQLLPVDAHETLARAESAISRLKTSIASHQSALERCAARLASAVDESLLDREDAIERLAADSHRFSKHPEDIAKRRASVDVLLDEVVTLARSLGLAGSDLATLRDSLPSELLRTTLGTLSSRRDLLANELRNKSEQQQRYTREIGELEKSLEGAPPADVPVVVIDALAKAQALGDVATRQRQQIEKHAEATRRSENALQRLAPWTGSSDELAALVVPDMNRLAEANNELTRLRASQNADRLQLEELRSDLRMKEAEVVARSRESGAILLEELAEARRARDQTWSGIRTSFVAGQVDGTDTDRRFRAEVLDLSIEKSDLTADRCEQGASGRARLEQATATRDDVAQRLQIVADRATAAEQALRQVERRWSDLLSPIGLASLDHTAILEWIRCRNGALTAHHEATGIAQEMQELSSDEHVATRALRTALLTSGRTSTELDGLALPALVTLARRMERDAAQSLGKREETQKRLERLRRDLPGVELALSEAAKERDAWNQLWLAALGAARLPAQTDPETIDQALGWFRDLESKIASIDEIRTRRISRMQADLAEFGDAALQLARAIASDLVARPPSEIAGTLRKRLEQARSAEARRREALAEQEMTSVELADCESEQSQIIASLAPLKDAAGVSTIDELRAAIDRSECARALEIEIAKATERVIEQGEGRSLSELESDDAEDERETRTARVEALQRQIAVAQTRAQECAVVAARAQSEFASIAGQGDAAAADNDREAALAEMRTAVERYAKVRAAAQLLSWAVERYRREKQGPLLKRASELFSVLTLGGFARLEADEEDGKPRLAGIRSSGDSVGVEGMSAGTRDQLYFALRVAALELQIERGTALPVVVDDVLINFDDSRAAAGMRVLAELSCRTQVLLFTHHRSVVEAGMRELGEQMHVVEL
jgi:uncharacterized protein YhaN